MKFISESEYLAFDSIIIHRASFGGINQYGEEMDIYVDINGRNYCKAGH